MKQVTFLVVDDDDIDIEILQRAFVRLRIANPIIRAENGLDALEILRGQNGNEKLEPPMIVLLDINMPKMSGMEFLKIIRADKDLRNLIVFVLTTSDDEGDILEAYDYNIAGYVVKSRAGASFEEALKMLEAYWRIVELPQ